MKTVKPFIWNPRLEDRLGVIGTMPQKRGAELCFVWLCSIGPGFGIYALTIARACVVHSATTLLEHSRSLGRLQGLLILVRYSLSAPHVLGCRALILE